MLGYHAVSSFPLPIFAVLPYYISPFLCLSLLCYHIISALSPAYLCCATILYQLFPPAYLCCATILYQPFPPAYLCCATILYQPFPLPISAVLHAVIICYCHSTLLENLTDEAIA